MININEVSKSVSWQTKQNPQVTQIQRMVFDFLLHHHFETFFVIFRFDDLLNVHTLLLSVYIRCVTILPCLMWTIVVVPNKVVKIVDVLLKLNPTVH